LVIGHCVIGHLVNQFDFPICDRFALAGEALALRHIQHFFGIAFVREFAFDDLEGAGLANAGPVAGGHNFGTLGHELLHHGRFAFFIDFVLFSLKGNGFHRFWISSPLFYMKTWKLENFARYAQSIFKIFQFFSISLEWYNAHKITAEILLSFFWLPTNCFNKETQPNLKIWH